MPIRLPGFISALVKDSDETMATVLKRIRIEINNPRNPKLDHFEFIKNLKRRKLTGYLYQILVGQRGTAVAQWLRCCSTNREVTVSIPDGVIVIFH